MTEEAETSGLSAGATRWTIPICALIGLLLGLLVFSYRTPIYEAETLVSVRNAPGPLTEQIDVVTSSAVLNSSSTMLGFEPDVSVTAAEVAGLLTITARSEDPRQAALAADAVANFYVQSPLGAPAAVANPATVPESATGAGSIVYSFIGLVLGAIAGVFVSFLQRQRSEALSKQKLLGDAEPAETEIDPAFARAPSHVTPTPVSPPPSAPSAVSPVAAPSPSLSIPAQNRSKPSPAPPERTTTRNQRSAPSPQPQPIVAPMQADEPIDTPNVRPVVDESPVGWFESAPDPSAGPLFSSATDPVTEPQKVEPMADSEQSPPELEPLEPTESIEAIDFAESIESVSHAAPEEQQPVPEAQSEPVMAGAGDGKSRSRTRSTGLLRKRAATKSTRMAAPPESPTSPPTPPVDKPSSFFTSAALAGDEPTGDALSEGPSTGDPADRDDPIDLTDTALTTDTGMNDADPTTTDPDLHDEAERVDPTEETSDAPGADPDVYHETEHIDPTEDVYYETQDVAELDPDHYDYAAAESDLDELARTSAQKQFETAKYELVLKHDQELAHLKSEHEHQNAELRTELGELRKQVRVQAVRLKSR